MRYLLLRLEVTGKRPIWSVDILPMTSMDFKNAILVWTRGSVKGKDSIVISDVLLSMERGGGDLGGLNIFLLLAKISLGGCKRLGKIFADKLQGEAGPSSAIASVNGRSQC